MDITKKITILNKTALETLRKSDYVKIVEKFTKTGLKILGGSFGYVFWKEGGNEEYKLIYKTTNTPYKPNPPRKKGYNYRVEKTNKPYMGLVKKERLSKYDLRKYMTSIVIVPIVFEENIYGNMVLCFKNKRTFNKEERSLTVALGNSAAQAITISRLYNNLREEKNNLEVRVKERTAELVKTNTMLKQEIAERRRTERALQASQHFIEQIANVVPGLIAVIDLKSGKYIYVNEAASRILGYNPDEFIQGGLEFAVSLMHPHDLHPTLDKNNQLITLANTDPNFDDDQIFSFEYRMRHKNGEWRWINTYGIVFDRNSDGQIAHILNISVDITERKKMEEALDEDRAKDEALLTSIGEGILATDAEGKIILINPEAERILGKPASGLVGKFLHEAQPILDEQGNELGAQQRPVYRALHKPKATAVKTDNVFYKKSSGELVPVSLTATPVIYCGKTIGVVQVFHDITKEKEIDRVKSELISLASHQLRTPLSAINWYTEALIKEEIGKLNKDQKKYMQQIFHANQKMVELVYDFLNVSRIELGTFSLKISTLNITELTQSITREIAPIINQKKLRVEEKFSRGLEQVRGDRKIIRLILQNLLTNAVKYTPDRGRVKLNIALERKNGKKANLLITVADNGYGIPKDQQDKIFTKLFRADNAAKLDAEGTGLGLYLVKSFVEFCKGKISFTSRENKGTTFYVSLPVEQATKQMAVASRQ